MVGKVLSLGGADGAFDDSNSIKIFFWTLAVPCENIEIFVGLKLCKNQPPTKINDEDPPFESLIVSLVLKPVRFIDVKKIHIHPGCKVLMVKSISF